MATRESVSEGDCLYLEGSTAEREARLWKIVEWDVSMRLSGRGAWRRRGRR